MRTLIPVLITAIFGGIFILVDGFPDFSWINTTLVNWNNISTAFAVLLTTFSLTFVHGRNLRRKDRAIYSGTLLFCLYGMIIIGIVFGNKHELYTTLFDVTAGNLESAVLSVVCFYIVSASYRVFRVRSKEAAVMMAATVLVMIGNTTIGEAIWSGLPILKEWLMNIPNGAAMRAITIGATLGGCATAIRILVGVERTHLGGGE